MVYKKLSFWGIILSCFLCTGGQPAAAGDPFANMSDEEFSQMLQFIDNVSKQFEEAYQKLSPEEQAQVDREMREILIQQGIDPDKLEPLNQPTAPQAATPPQPIQQIKPTPQVAECTGVVTHNKDQVSCLVENLITLIDTFRQKLIIAPFEIPLLRHWLDMLAFSVKTLNTAEHLSRLSHEKFDRLFQLLVKLEKTLTQYEKKMAIPTINIRENDEQVYLDPYHILGIRPRASAEDITTAYEALQAAYNLEKIEQDLAAQQTKPAHMKRKLDAIKLQLRNIEDAYHQLNDPKLRAQIDRNALVTYQQQVSLEEEAQRIAYDLQNSLHQLVINGIVETCDQFFAQFEPVAVAHRKEMEAAEQQRRTEQEARHKLVAAPSPYRGQSSEYPDWFPPYEQYAAPAAQPMHGSPSEGFQPSRGAPATPPSSEKEQKKGGEKMKQDTGRGSEKKAAEQKEKEGSKRAADKKTKAAQNPVEEFRKSIEKLDALMKTAAEKLALPEYQPILDTLAKNSQLLDSDTQLQDSFTLMLDAAWSNDKLMKQLETIRKLADDLKKSNTTGPLMSMWTAHKNRHAPAYATLTTIAHILKNIHQQHPARALPHPWEYVIESDEHREHLDKLAGIQQHVPQPQQPAKQRQMAQEHASKEAALQRLSPTQEKIPEEEMKQNAQTQQLEEE